jgi:hypothetical protein
MLASRCTEQQAGRFTMVYRPGSNRQRSTIGCGSDRVRSSKSTLPEVEYRDFGRMNCGLVESHVAAQARPSEGVVMATSDELIEQIVRAPDDDVPGSSMA